MKTLGGAILFFAFLAGLGEAADRAPVGTFSNLEYRPQSGDLVGVEIKIVPTSRGFQGALLIAQGLPREFIVVAILFEGNRVRFVVPASYDVYGGTEFEGVFDRNTIRGRMRYPTGAVQDVRLARRGHWDSPTSERSRPAKNSDTPPQPSK